MTERTEISLIAREKYDKITFWLCAGIIGLCHSIIIDTGLTKNNWFLLIPSICSVITLLCDYISNIIYFIISDYTDKIDIPNKGLNICKLIFALISLITFLLTYIIYLV